MLSCIEVQILRVIVIVIMSGSERTEDSAKNKRKCTFSDKLRSKFTYFQKGRTEFEAKCPVCDCFINLESRGGASLSDHLQSAKHKASVQGTSTSQKLDKFLENPQNEAIRQLDKKVQAAEATLSYHTVMHHQSFKSVDCTVPLNGKIFNDSSIVRKVQCKRTKTEAIVKNVLFPHFHSVVITKLKSIRYYSIATDASNHKNLKIFPLLVQYFDPDENGIARKIIKIGTNPNEESKTVSNYIVNTLSSYEIEKGCIAFSGDNTNTNFGGKNRKADGENIFRYLKEKLERETLIGIGCPAHILHNCLHYGFSGLKYDVECLVLKIFNFFSIYTVRTEVLKDFCNFVEITYQPLLYHSKTRWLSIFPAIERILKLYPALKSFFLSQKGAPKFLVDFFNDEFAEYYLWFLQSIMFLFHTHISSVEKSKNSIIEVCDILSNVLSSLKSRQENSFLPLNVSQALIRLKNDGYERECDQFKVAVLDIYERAIEYIEQWLGPFEEFQVFTWLNLKKLHEEDVKYDTILISITYLQSKNVEINDSKLFDQFCALKNFLKTDPRAKKLFELECIDEQWSFYFNCCINVDAQCSELLTIAEFYFAIPAHNAILERIFSLIEAQWTDERNRLSVTVIEAMISLLFNCKMSCTEFYDYVLQTDNATILQKISSQEKYDFKQ